jgi:hypothetical protein
MFNESVIGRKRVVIKLSSMVQRHQKALTGPVNNNQTPLCPPHSHATLMGGVFLPIL